MNTRLIKSYIPKPSASFWIVTGISVVIIIAVIIWYVVSVSIDPKAFENTNNRIYLLGGIILSLANFLIGNTGTIIDAVKEAGVKKRSEESLLLESNNCYRDLNPRLLGIRNIIPRNETGQILSRLTQNNGVLFTGDAGYGKSGIGVALVEQAKNIRFTPLLFDVRRFSNIGRRSDLMDHFGIQEPISDVISRIGLRNNGCLLILDQLDNIAGLPSGNVIVEFALECRHKANIKVVVISRHSEIEKTLLRPLLEANFGELPCRELDTDVIKNVLHEHGFLEPPDQIINLGKNLLNLDLICAIIFEVGVEELGNADTSLSLWERYVDVFLEREHRGSNISKDVILSELEGIARTGLLTPDRGFFLHDPPTILQSRFLSQGLFSKLSNSTRRYIFKIESLQDYLFVRYATRNNYLKRQVEEEIYFLHQRNIYRQMIDQYQRDASPVYEEFLEEVLNG